MDLFSITCTTCKSRLRVRDEGAIGQILACPKCHGMVMVKAPEGWEPGKPLPPPLPEQVPGITAVVEMKRTDDTSSDANFDAIDDILENAPPKPKRSIVTVAADAPGLARPRFAGNPHQHPAGGSSVGKNGQAATSAVAEPPIVAKEGKPAVAAKGEPDRDEPIPDFTQPRPWRYWLLLAASVLAGVGLAVAVVVASVKVFTGQPQQAAQVNPTQASTSPGHQTIPSVPVEPVAPRPTPVVPSPAITPEPTPADPKPQVDPVATTPTAPTTPPAPQPAPPTKPEIPIEQILEQDRGPQETTEPAVTKPATPPATATAEDENPAKPLLPRPEPREVDLAARLADPIAALETSGTPLVDFLQVMSDLSTIPITLEPDALLLAKVSVTSPVAVKLTSTTVGAALTDGLSRLGLEHVQIDGQLVVRLIEPADLLVLPYPHKDLTGGDAAAAAELADMIQALVDPPSWKQGEEGPSIAVEETLKVKQRRANHAQIFLLCEKLRTARKLKHASKFPPALFQLDSRTKQAAAKLKTPVSLNLQQPTSLVKLLSQLEQTSGVRILVDWRDIAAAGWTPAAEATLVVEKESLALALTKLLEPMDLAWRVVDGQTIQVVMPATLAERPELELYSVGELTKDDPSGQKLVSEIRETLGEALFLDQGGRFEIRFDVAGQCLVASLPQPKQQDLEAFLMLARRPQ